MGTAPIGPICFGDGHRCVGGTIIRFWPPTSSGPLGISTLGAGISTLAPILPGDTWLFQNWYRDSSGPCGSGFNFTNAFAITFL